MNSEQFTHAHRDWRGRESARLLRIAGPLMFTYFAFIIVAHATMLDGVARPIMMLTAAVTSILSAVIGVSAHRGTPWIVSRAAHCLTFAGILAALNSAMYLVLSPEPVQTTNLMLVMIAAALFLTQRRGLGLIYAFLGLTFVAVATQYRHPDWIHFGVSLATSAAIGIALAIARERNHATLSQSSFDEQLARRSLESALTGASLSELRFRTVVDRCPDAIFVTRNGVIRYANPAADVLLDVREGTVVGTSVTDLRPSEASHLLGEDGDRIQLLDSSGQTISAATSTTEVHFDGDSMQVVFARDMSERLASEKLQSDFLAAVSHELRTPLTSVVGAIGLLARGGMDPREQTLLDVASRNAGRLAELIEDLLDLRTLETLDESDLHDTPLVSIVKTAVASFADPGKRIHIHTDKDVWVHGDPRALGRVVHHLVDNAVKFGGVDKDIEIRISTVADDACIHVSDRGPGVPRRYRETVFRGFAQGKAGLARPHGGFGVGLTLSRGIVQQHKGRMTLHDRDGGGATVTICLPRIEPPAG